MRMMAGWSEQDLELGDVKLHLWRGGRGRPVLVLHHDIGAPERLPFYDALADKFDVIVPRHPGFGVQERPQWMRHPRDIAALYQWLLADLGVENASLVGLGFGGWVAAEMAALAPRAARGALRGRRCRRALRRHGAARGARPARHPVYRAELARSAGGPPAAGRRPAVQFAAVKAKESPMHVMYFTEQPMSAYPADI